MDTEEEAERLLIATCPRNRNGEFVAPELAEEQTLDRLYAFSDRLHEVHERMRERGACTCAEEDTMSKTKQGNRKKHTKVQRSKNAKPAPLPPTVERSTAMKPCEVKTHFDCGGLGTTCDLCGEGVCDCNYSKSKCKDCDGTGRLCVEHESPCGAHDGVCDAARRSS